MGRGMVGNGEWGMGILGDFGELGLGERGEGNWGCGEG